VNETTAAASAKKDYDTGLPNRRRRQVHAAGNPQSAACARFAPPLISADAAARALCVYFLVNADRGDNAANDKLVAELVRPMRAGSACCDGASCPTTVELDVLRHCARGAQ
jgi:hypothetical protein